MPWVKTCSNWGMGLNEKDPHAKSHDFTGVRHSWAFLEIVFGLDFKNIH